MFFLPGTSFAVGPLLSILKPGFNFPFSPAISKALSEILTEDLTGHSRYAVF
jgi:hypothetical protein